MLLVNTVLYLYQMSMTRLLRLAADVLQSWAMAIAAVVVHCQIVRTNNKN